MPYSVTDRRGGDLILKTSGCICVEDVCTRDLRRILRGYIGKHLTLITLSGRKIAGRLTRVNQGTVVVSVKGVLFYVPICRL